MELDFSPFVRHAAKTAYYLRATVRAYDNRLLYFISGSGTFTVGDEEYRLTQGVLIFYPPGIEYRITADEDALFYTVNFDFNKGREDVAVMLPVEPKNYDPSLAISYLPHGLRDFFSDPIYLPNAFFAEGDLSEVCREFISDSLGNDEICSLHIKRLLIKLIRAKEEKEQKNSLCRLIKKTVSEMPNSSNTEIAKKLGYHPYYLSSLLKKNEGISLHRYVLKERLKLAYVDVSSTATPIEEIAAKYGFSSGAHFSVAFKKEFFINPGALRRI